MRKSASNKNIFACVVKGTLWGIAFGAVSLLISAAVGLSLPDPEKYSAPLALAVLFISAFVGAFVSAKKFGESGLRAGLFSGVLFLLVLALAALGFGPSIKPLMFAICAAVILVTSAFAGISGASHKPRKRRKF